MTVTAGCAVSVEVLGIQTVMSDGTSAAVDIPGDVIAFTCLAGGLIAAYHSILNWIPG